MADYLSKDELARLARIAGHLTITDVSGIDGIVMKSGKEPECLKSLEECIRREDSEGFFRYPGRTAEEEAGDIHEKLNKLANMMIVPGNNTIWVNDEWVKAHQQYELRSNALHEIVHIIDGMKHTPLVDKKALATKEGRTNHLTLLESHAKYIQMKDRAGIGGYVDGEIASAKRTLTPYLSKYVDGLELINGAYKKGIHISKIFSNLPTKDDFANPGKYLKRISYD